MVIENTFSVYVIWEGLWQSHGRIYYNSTKCNKKSSPSIGSIPGRAHVQTTLKPHLILNPYLGEYM